MWEFNQEMVNHLVGNQNVAADGGEVAMKKQRSQGSSHNLPAPLSLRHSPPSPYQHLPALGKSMVHVPVHESPCLLQASVFFIGGVRANINPEQFDPENELIFVPPTNFLLCAIPEAPPLLGVLLAINLPPVKMTNRGSLSQ